MKQTTWKLQEKKRGDRKPYSNLRLQAWVTLDTNLMEIQRVVDGRNSIGSENGMETNV